MGPGAGLYACGKSCPYRNSIPGQSSPYRVIIPTELSRPQLQRLRVINEQISNWINIASRVYFSHLIAKPFIEGNKISHKVAATG